MKKYCMLLVLTLIVSSLLVSQNIDGCIRKITSDSELFDKQKRYCVDNLIDKKSGTSWVEGNSNDKGSIVIEFSGRTIIRNIYIRNGFHNPEYYYANNRARNIEILFRNGYARYRLKDNPGFQKISFPESIATNILTIKIIDSYRGDKYNDTCISEITFDEPNNDLLKSQFSNYFEKYSKSIYDDLNQKILNLPDYKDFDRNFILDRHNTDKIESFSELSVLNTNCGKLIFINEFYIDRNEDEENISIISIYHLNGEEIVFNQNLIPMIETDEIDANIDKSGVFYNRYGRQLENEIEGIRDSIEKNELIVMSILSFNSQYNKIQYQLYNYNKSRFYHYFLPFLIETDVQREVIFNLK